MSGILSEYMTGKKLLALSDTHGNIPALEAVLNWAADGKIDTAVFLGDGLQDFHRAAAAGFSPEWIKVKGNNDYAPSVPEAAVFNFCGHRFFLCHGHRYRLYSGYDALTAAARNAEAEAVLFGHAHVPVFQTAGNVLLINPGSIGRPRGTAGATFAVIGCVPGKPLDVKFWSVGSRGEILEFN
jgi:putative phosphoesterase